MLTRDRVSAISVAVIWGLNFPATALALDHFPPIFTVALRFGLLAIPTILFVPRPKVGFLKLAMVGLGLGVGQFAFLYLGMAAGMPAGLASIVLQASAPFTVLLAGLWLKERLSRRQLIGVGFAVLALAAIAIERWQSAALLPVILTLLGAAGWAFGNVSTKRAKPQNPLHLTLWWSVIPPLPMLALSLGVEGPQRIGDSLVGAFAVSALPSVFGLLYIVLIATILGYGQWTRLMNRYPSSTVAPFSMLVPVIGVLTSWLILGEIPGLFELIAGGCVVAGVLYASAPARRRRDAEVAGVAEDVVADADAAEAEPSAEPDPATEPEPDPEPFVRSSPGA